MRGPTDYSNWLVKDQIIVGAYPGSINDEYHERSLTAILNAGVSTFVCLQRELLPNATDEEWRSGRTLRPYHKDLVGIAKRMRRHRAGHVDQKSIRFVYFPITDQAVVRDADAVLLIKELMAEIVKGRKLYIHCHGGHGRAGTVAAILLGVLFNMSPPEALSAVQAFHDERINHQHARSPQVLAQVEQVYRIINTLQASKDLVGLNMYLGLNPCVNIWQQLYERLEEEAWELSGRDELASVDNASESVSSSSTSEQLLMRLPKQFDDSAHTRCLLAQLAAARADSSSNDNAVDDNESEFTHDSMGSTLWSDTSYETVTTEDTQGTGGSGITHTTTSSSNASGSPKSKKSSPSPSRTQTSSRTQLPFAKSDSASQSSVTPKPASHTYPETKTSNVWNESTSNTFQLETKAPATSSLNDIAHTSQEVSASVPTPTLSPSLSTHASSTILGPTSIPIVPANLIPSPTQTALSSAPSAPSASSGGVVEPQQSASARVPTNGITSVKTTTSHTSLLRLKTSSTRSSPASSIQSVSTSNVTTTSRTLRHSISGPHESPSSSNAGLNSRVSPSRDVKKHRSGGRLIVSSRIPTILSLPPVGSHGSLSVSQSPTSVVATVSTPVNSGCALSATSNLPVASLNPTASTIAPPAAVQPVAPAQSPASSSLSSPTTAYSGTVITETHSSDLQPRGLPIALRRALGPPYPPRSILTRNFQLVGARPNSSSYLVSSSPSSAGSSVTQALSALSISSSSSSSSPSSSAITSAAPVPSQPTAGSAWIQHSSETIGGAATNNPLAHSQSATTSNLAMTQTRSRL